MKIKNLLVLGVFALLELSVFGQAKKKVNPKHINYYRPVSIDTKEVKIELQDAVSMMEFAKFKLKLTNNTNDYLLYKPKESLFKLETGDFSPVDKKNILLSPLEKESRVIDMKDPAKNAHVESMKFVLNGLYQIPINVAATEAANFALPASANSFDVGNFKIEMLLSKKTTAETIVKFKVTYTGEGMGLIDYKKLGVKIESGQVFANDKKGQALLLSKGESDTFLALFHIDGKIVDMQFANMFIVWNDTFKDCSVIKLNENSIDLVLDPGMTDGKNK